MSTIRYTLGGTYNPDNSAEVTASSGIDFSDQAYRSVGRVDGADEFYVASSSGGSLLRTADGSSLLLPSTSGIQVDFSDKTGLVFLTGGDLGDSLRSGSNDDTLDGGGGNDVLEGGIGINTINGGAGVNTVSYEHFNSGSDGISVLLYDHVAYDGFGAGYLDDTLSNIQNIRGSAMNDRLYGDSGNNVIEGGIGADFIHGMFGIDTATYINSSSGVTVNLDTGTGAGGDATGDTIRDIENLIGSTHNDILTGNAVANTLTGNGGSDSLYGGAGADRLVISDTPTQIDGGADTDFLFVSGGGSVSLSQSTFIGIESVYVRNDTHLDMSQVTSGSRIVSQSTADHGVEIIGTSGADTIRAGKGGDVIEGGAGSDKLFAGAGSDTFHFEAGFGRDNVYGFNVATDHLTVDIAGVDARDIKLTAFHGGQDTIVSFVGVEGVNKIILHDVSIAQIEAGPSDLFTFGA